MFDSSSHSQNIFVCSNAEFIGGLCSPAEYGVGPMISKMIHYDTCEPNLCTSSIFLSIHVPFSSLEGCMDIQIGNDSSSRGTWAIRLEGVLSIGGIREYPFFHPYAVQS